MGILITSVNLGDVVIQGGQGVPNHIGTRGTLYVDFDAGIEYINKDGINTWAAQLDSTSSGGTGTTGFDVFVTGGTYNNITGVATFTNNTGGTFIVTGFSTTSSTFTGGTVTGPTNFTAGLTSTTVTAGGITATTISATTYLGLPPDIFVTGGTMSGNTARFTNSSGGTFNVNGIVNTATTININGVVKTLNQNNEWLTLQGNTGILDFSSGLTLNNATAGTINIATMFGYIVDNETNPAIPTHIFVNYSGSPTSGVTVTTRNSGQASYVLLNSSSIPIFQNTFPTSAERKQNIWLGKIAHPLTGTITTVINEPDFLTSPQSQVSDLFQAINYINDNVYPYFSGANLSFNITNGNIHGNGINLHNSRLIPNEIQMGPITSGATFFYRTQTGGTDTGTTFIDPTNYDVGGVVTPVPATASTIQWIFAVPGAGFVVQYGQFLYPSLLNAIINIGREQFVVFPNLIENAILIGVVAITQSATTLSSSTQAQIFRADKFGQIVGAQAGVSTTNLQNAYDNSVQPQLVITPVGGALQIKGFNDFNPTIQGLNTADTPTFSVDGFGNLSATTLHGATGGTIGLVLGVQGLSGVPDTFPIAEFSDQTGNFSDWNFRVAGNGDPIINFITSNGTLEAPTINTGPNEFGEIVAWGYTSAYTRTSQMLFAKDGTPTVSSLPSKITFYTTPSGSLTMLERFSINNQGQLAINASPSAGTTSDSILVRTSAGLVRQIPSTSITFTGGTVTGATRFTNGLTANTISATTYLGLPTDIRVTGGTVSGSSTIFTNNTGGTFNVTGTSFWAFSGTGSTITNTNIGNVIIKGLDTGATDALQVTTSANTVFFRIGNDKITSINTNKDTTSSLNIGAANAGGGNNYSLKLFDFSNNNFASFRGGVGIECATYNSLGASNTTVNGNQALFLNYVNPNNGGISMTSSGPPSVPLNNTTRHWVSVAMNLTPFSGSSALTMNVFSIIPTISFSATSSTLVRGLYINPTLTSLTGTNEYRAIEVSTGKTILDTLVANSITATTISATTYLNVPSSNFSGGTVNGATYFQNGLSANTISATTYLGLPPDVYVTAGTFSTIASTITFTNTTGGTFSVTGLSVNASFSGGTVTGATIFTGGLSANSLSATSSVINSLTAGTLSATSIISNSLTSTTISATSIISNSLTSTTISATTYLGLPPDIFVTAGTFSSSSSTIIFTNTTGGTFNVTGITTSTPFTGGTVTGATFFSNGLSANTISATTYLGLPAPVITGQTNFVSKFTSGNTLTSSTIFDNGTLVQIGTTAATFGTLPSDGGRLSINNTSGSNGLSIFNGIGGYYFNINSTNSDAIGVKFTWFDGNSTPFLQYAGNIGTILGRTVGGNPTTITGQYTAFQIFGIEKMRLNPFGNLGIGSTGLTGTTRLEVSGNSRFISNVSGTTVLISSNTQNVLTVIGSGNSNTSPIFSVQGSQGELFSVSDSLTGSLFSVNDISGLPVLEAFSDSTILMGSYLAPSLNTTVKIITSAGTNNIYSIPTSAYTGAFIDYTVANGLNLRAGNFMAVWTSATTQYTETSTNDIGNTSGITFSMIISGSNAVLRASGTTSGWTIKSIIRSI